MSAKLITAVAVLLAGVALAVVLMTGATESTASTSNALTAMAPPMGLAQVVPAGRVWGFGEVALCTTGAQPVTLTSIQPVKQSGAIQLNNIEVREVTRITAHPELKSIPANLQPVKGFIVQGHSPCRWPAPTSRFYQVVVVAVRNGPGGGKVQGLRVAYQSGKAQGTYTIPFTFALCDPKHPNACTK